MYQTHTTAPRTMTWYLRSLNTGDMHRGTMSRGMVHTPCGLQFHPIGRVTGGLELLSELPNPELICPQCPLTGSAATVFAVHGLAVHGLAVHE